MSDDLYSDAVTALAGSVDAAELAEWHGTLTGILCAASDARLPARLAALGMPGASGQMAGLAEDAEGQPATAPSPVTQTPSLQDGPADLAAAEAERLVHITRDALADPALAFQPLLLGDAPLTERAQALANWCQGFLVGLATTCRDVMEHTGGEAREALEDFSQLALAVRGGEAAEEAEAAYAELVEFVRVGVQLVHEELRPLRHGPPPGPARSAAGGAAGNAPGSDESA